MLKLLHKHLVKALVLSLLAPIFSCLAAFEAQAQGGGFLVLLKTLKAL